MNLSYQEKLVCGQLLRMVLLDGYYFARVSQGRHGVAAGSLVGVLVWIAVIQVIFSTLVAALTQREPRDERDQSDRVQGFQDGLSFGDLRGAFRDVAGVLGGPAVVGRAMVVTCALGVLVGVETLRMGTILVLHRMPGCRHEDEDEDRELGAASAI